MGPSSRTVLGERLHSHGLRATAQRRAILDVFDDPDVGHLTADEVLGRARLRLPELSRATVYNALGEFVDAGLLRPISGGRLQVFEAVREPHEHFRCQECGSIYDVSVEGLDLLSLRREGFSVRTVLLEGTCAACARRG